MMALASLAAVLAVISTLTFYTTLIGRPNIFYSYAEHVYLATSMGWYFVVAAYYILDRGLTPILAGNYAPLGGMILGILMWTRFSKEYGYIARIPMAIAIGIGTGITLRAIIFTGFIDQIKATILPLWTGEPLTSFNNIVTIVTALTVMLFFFFSFERKGVLKGVSTIGEYALYLAFGTYFASTFLGRYGLFIGRMSYLTAPENLTTSLIIGIAILVMLVVMGRMDILEKYSPE